LPITIYGHKILREKTDTVESINDSIVDLILNMRETMKNASGVGLAANQVGANKQVFVADISEVEGYEDIKPIIAVNPTITYYSINKNVMEEGCLSIPGIKGEVPRATEIDLTYFDGSLNKHEIRASGFFARVIQHEYDHLQGKLFIDLLDAVAQKKITKQLFKIQKFKIIPEYPYAKHSDLLIL